MTTKKAMASVESTCVRAAFSNTNTQSEQFALLTTTTSRPALSIPRSLSPISMPFACVPPGAKLAEFESPFDAVTIRILGGSAALRAATMRFRSARRRIKVDELLRTDLLQLFPKSLGSSRL
jgi:hypothetical protein